MIARITGITQCRILGTFIRGAPPFWAVIYPTEKRLRGAPFNPDSAQTKDTRARLVRALFCLELDILPALKDGDSSCERPMPGPGAGWRLIPYRFTGFRLPGTGLNHPRCLSDAQDIARGIAVPVVLGTAG